MLRKLWLIFAQVCTLCLAVLFVVSTLRPDLLPRGGSSGNRGSNVVLLQETATAAHRRTRGDLRRRRKEGDAGGRQHLHQQGNAPRNPVLDDPMLRRYFPDLADKLPRQRATSLGSGVIVSREGFVLTNNHVIEGADDIQLVLADGRRLKARVRGADPESDLAVLKTEGENLPAITFGNLESAHVGDVVLAIGNPFGFGNTVTMGIVSALGRSHLGINRFEDFIQTDAAINPGNSGGALVDAAGNLIGINSTIFSQSGGSLGIGFAIPVSLARAVLEQLIKDGEVTRGWLGIEPQELTSRDGAGDRDRERRRADPLHRAERAGRPRRHARARHRDRDRRQADPRHARAARAHRRAFARQHQQGDRLARKKQVSFDVTVGRRPKRNSKRKPARSAGAQFMIARRLRRRRRPRRGGTAKRASRMPISYSSHSGTASSSCDTTSGGVNTAPTTNAPTITYERIAASFSSVTTRRRTSTITTTGTSNVIPKAMNIVSTNDRYLSMSVIIWTPAGA